MTVLVADVGGTNARLGLCNAGQLDTDSIMRFVNADYATFYETIAAYMVAMGQPSISACVVALAGPISGHEGRLTNRNWTISTQGLMTATHSAQAMLMNDLSSLGYSLQNLTADGVAEIAAGSTLENSNAQSVVIGIGTGFNVCPVKLNLAGIPTCLQAEAGHIDMPPSVLEASKHPLANTFKTVEDLFSGRGISCLYATLSGGPALPGDQISARFADDSDGIAKQTMELYAEMLGLLTRELVLIYMPLGGVYFAGSVARGIFDAGLGKIFTDAFYADDHFLQNIRDIPVRVIKDDSAGLIGCEVAAKSLDFN